ncbi:MAG: ABC transporter substrate-binding protein, partial [Acidimicrobiales bacterium]
IFPLLPLTSDTVEDAFWFIDELYRPLYWFGSGSSLALDPAESIANQPVFSNGGRTVTITLKHWTWSEGKPVTTRDVQFYFNLLKAGKASYANYVPGRFPDNVVSEKWTSSTTFSLTFDRVYNEHWLLYNQLAQMFAFPQQTWDLTASGAKSVYDFLNKQSQDVNTYSTNPLWRVVDGPYELSGYQPSGNVTMVPNPKYSGPVKSKISKLVFESFTSDSSEYVKLLAGGVDYGYVPFQDLASDARVTAAGYHLAPWPQAGMNYAFYNLSNPVTGALFRQFYIRQAMQHLVDQAAMVKVALSGLGIPDYGPVPAYSPEPKIGGQPLYTAAEQTDSYPYSISAATALLRSHGWSIHPGGVDTCVRPGSGPDQCGPGIAAGKALSFPFEFPSGITQDATEVASIASAASSTGIQIVQRSVPLNTTYNTALCTSSTPASACWSVDYYYLGGWQYGMPINYPVGDLIFQCPGTGDGGWCSPQLDRIMTAAETTNSTQPLYQYENYVHTNLPVLWLPLQDYQLSAISDRLHGATPQNPGYWINPQYWYRTAG